MNTSSKQFSWEDLPEELKEIFDENDVITYQSLIPDDMPTLISSEEYTQGKMKSARKLVKHRKYTAEMKILYDKYESGKLPAVKAEELMRKARDRYMEED